MAKYNDAQHYDFSTWQGNLLGGKPTGDLLHTVHALGLRPGKQALANAMMLRPAGATGSEVVIACGAPQLNRMRGLVADGVVKREAHAPRNGHTVYKLTLTPKGEKAVAKHDAAPQPDTQGEAPAKPAKVKAKGDGKAKRKPRTAKPAPVTGEATAAVPMTAAQAEMVQVPTGDAPVGDQPQV